MRQLVLWGLTVWLVIEALANVVVVGQEREPKTPGAAAFAVAVIAVMIAVIHWLVV